jgi:large subunit ribosomal protein L19
MTNIISNFEKEQVAKILASRTSGFEKEIKIGDLVSVKYKITEGTNVRIQAFNGVVIAKTKDFSNYAATFTVRKISSGIGVERKFTYYSPLLAGVEILKSGVVRRAKLYYLRSLTGKASRIKEKMDYLPQVLATEPQAKPV